MLGKALKYDLKSIYKLWLLLSIIMLLLSAVCGVCLRIVMTPTDPTEHFSNWMIFPILFIGIAIIAFGAYAVFSFVYPIMRFYKHFFTDEGYLTFTLPIKRSTLLNAKLLNTFIWNALSGVVLTLSLVIVFLIAPANMNGTGIMLVTVFEEFKQLISSLIPFIDGWMWASFVIGIVMSIVYSIFSTLLIYAAVTFGCVVAKKHKVLLSIGVYYLAGMALSFVSFIFTTLFSIANSALVTIAADIGVVTYNLIYLFTYLCAALFFIVLSVFVYNFILSRIEKRLNLA